MIEHPKIDCSFLTSFFWVFLAFVTNTISRVVSDINLRFLRLVRGARDHALTVCDEWKR